VNEIEIFKLDRAFYAYEFGNLMWLEFYASRVKVCMHHVMFFLAGGALAGCIYSSYVSRISRSSLNVN
jgi:hypothetical protein